MSNWKPVEKVFEGESIKAADMKIGSSVQGKLTAISESPNFPGAFHLYLDDDGEITKIFTSGNLSFKAKDGDLVVGNTYKITRIADVPSKKKGFKARTTFEVLVDQDNLVAVLPAI